jgi:hypothetical protein
LTGYFDWMHFELLKASMRDNIHMHSLHCNVNRTVEGEKRKENRQDKIPLSSHEFT